MSRTRLRTPLEISIGVVTAAAIVASIIHAGAIADLRAPGSRVHIALVALLVGLALAYAAIFRPRARIGVTSLAAAAIALLGLLSFSWSVAPRDSLRTAVALALLVAAAWALGAAASESPAVATAVMAGLAGAGGIVAAASFVYLVLRPHEATFVLGGAELSRFRGLGENANTVPVVVALTVGPASWWAMSRSQLTAAFGGSAVVLLLAASVATGSRGSTVAAVVAVATFAALVGGDRRRRIALGVVAAAALTALAAGADTHVPSLVDAKAPAAAQTVVLVENGQSLPTSAPQFPGNPGHLHSEVGRAELLGGGGIASGRIDAWRGAIEQGLERPIAGYGLGTEDPVFVDRYPGFQGSYVESSFVGALLHLGLGGVIALLAVFAGALAAVVRARRAHGGVAVAAGATVVAGAVLGLVQSYALAPAGVGALPLWVALLLAGAYGDRRLRAPARVATGLALACAVVVPLGMYQSSAHTRELRDGIRNVHAAAGPLSGPSLAAFRVTWFGDCFSHRAGGVPYALEECYDRSGRLIEAIDRRGEEPRFWSLRFDRDETPVVVAPEEIRAVLEEAGGTVYSERYLRGYPPTAPLADSTLILIRPWLEILRAAAPGAGPGSA